MGGSADAVHGSADPMGRAADPMVVAADPMRGSDSPLSSSVDLMGRLRRPYGAAPTTWRLTSQWVGPPIADSTCRSAVSRRNAMQILGVQADVCPSRAKSASIFSEMCVSSRGPS